MKSPVKQHEHNKGVKRRRTDGMREMAQYSDHKQSN